MHVKFLQFRLQFKWLTVLLLLFSVISVAAAEPTVFSDLRGDEVFEPVENDFNSFEEFERFEGEEFIIEFSSEGDFGALNSAERDLDINITREYEHVFDGAAVEGDRRDLESIPWIDEVHPVREYQLMTEEAFEAVNADQVGAGSGRNPELTGKDIEVAVVDTGIDYTHPDFGGCEFESSNGLEDCEKILDWEDFTDSSSSNPMDDDGHGTHVAGTIVANGSLKGVAPEAQLMAYNVFEEQGGSLSASTSDIVDAVDRSVAEDADIVSMSLGVPEVDPDFDNPLRDSLENALNQGVLPVVAAGNDGSNLNTVGFPGNLDTVLTVGATDYQGNMAGFSSRGPELWDEQGSRARAKPNVVAPGVSINSTYPMDQDEYETLPGTSMATPVVSGTAALLLQQEKRPPEQLISIIESTSIDQGSPEWSQGSGFIDAEKAVAGKSVALDPVNIDFERVDSSEDRQKYFEIENLWDSELELDAEFLPAVDLVEGEELDRFMVYNTSIKLQPGESKELKIEALPSDDAFLSSALVLNHPQSQFTYNKSVASYVNYEMDAKADVNVEETIASNQDSFEVNTSSFEALHVNRGGNLSVENVDTGQSVLLEDVGESRVQIEDSELGYSGGETLNASVKDGGDTIDFDTAQVGELEASIVARNSSTNEELDGTDTVEAGLESIELDASETNSDGDIVEYWWDINDSGLFDRSTGTEKTEVTYNTTGEFKPKLEVENEFGAIDSEQLDFNLTVNDTTKPDINASIEPDPAEAGLEEIEFNASNSTDNVEIDRFEWVIENSEGREKLSANEKRFHETFNETGSYTANLSVNDTSGNEAFEILEFNVSDETPPHPVIDFGFEDREVELGLEEALFDASDSTDNVEIDSFNWSITKMGDEEFSSGEEVFNQSFDELGNYTAELVVTDTSGNENSTSEVFEVVDTTPPSALFDANTTFSIPDAVVEFNASESFDNDEIANYSWSLNGEEAAFRDEKELFETNLSEDTDVGLNVTDFSGNFNFTEKFVEVEGFDFTVESGEDYFTNEPELNISFNRPLEQIDAAIGSDTVNLETEDDLVFNGSKEVGNGLKAFEFNVTDKEGFDFSGSKDLRVNPPQIQSFTVNRSFLMVNETARFESDISDVNFDLVEVKVGGEVFDLENQTSEDDNTTLWALNKGFNRTGELDVELEVVDEEGLMETNMLSLDIRNRSELVVESDSTIKVEDTMGELRAEDNMINSSVPADNNYTIEIDNPDVGIDLGLDNVDISKDISTSFNSTSIDPELDDHEVVEAAQFSTGFNFTEVSLTLDEEVDTVFRCDSWTGECESSFEEVEFSTEDGESEVSRDDLSAYVFANEKEDDEDEDNGSNGGSTDSSSSAPPSGGGGSEPELSIEESENSITIDNIFEGQHSVSFNQTGLPIKALAFDAAEEGKIEFEETTVNESLLFESGFTADTELNNSFELDFAVSKQWMNETRLGPSQIGLYRSENGRWLDLGGDEVERTDLQVVFNVEVDTFSTFALGAGQTCYSMSSVDAVAEDSCSTFENTCSVPDSGEIVDSCSSWTKEQEIRNTINEIRGETSGKSGGEVSQKLDEAEQLLNQEDIQTAEQLVNEARQTNEDTGLESSQIINILAPLMILGLLSIVGFFKLRPVYKEKKLMRKINSLKAELTQKSQENGDIQELAEKVGEANKALLQEEYDKCEQLISEAQQIQ